MDRWIACEQPDGKRGDGEGEAPVKQCPNDKCEAFVPASARYCECGWKFPDPEPKQEDQADTTSQIISEPEIFEVQEIHYARHEKKSSIKKPPTLRIDYECLRQESDENMRERISEWVCIEHPLGFAKEKAKQWWSKHSDFEMPSSVDDAIEIANRGGLADCRRIKARKQEGWWRILEHDLGDKPQELAPVHEWEDEEIPF